jgi:hypothetical protein
MAGGAGWVVRLSCACVLACGKIVRDFCAGKLCGIFLCGNDDATMRRCDDATMRRCDDATMRRCDDATMRRCDDDGDATMALNGAQWRSMALCQQSKIIRHFCSGKRQQIDDSGKRQRCSGSGAAAVNGKVW